MAANYTHTARSDGTVLTAAIYNADHNNHINNMIPDKIDDYSVNLAEMQTTTDPYPGAVASLATHLGGELERIRFLIAQITGEAQWYIDPDSTIAALNTALAGKVDDVAGTANNIATLDGTGELQDSGVKTDGAGEILLETGSTLGDTSTSVSIDAIYDTDAMTENDANGLATQQSIKAYVDAEVGGVLTFASAVSTASGTPPTTAVSSIPATANVVVIAFNQVSLSGTETPLVQVGHSAGTFITSGYSTSVTQGSLTATSTTGFEVFRSASSGAVTLSGTFTLTHIGSNLWVGSGTLNDTTGTDDACICGGIIDMGANVLDAVQINDTGANTFDGGSVRAYYY